jgi:cell filamentation protein
MSRYSSSDSYVDPETGVLTNRLGIRNQSSLEKAEARLVSIRSQQLWLNPFEGRFDLSYLKSVHRHLFQDVYAWEGELRTVDISKGESRFAHHAFLEGAALATLETLAGERYLAEIDTEVFCARMAFYLGELNALHPFREGNGRACREFIGLLARRNGYVFRWKAVNQTQWLRASIDSFHGKLDGMTMTLRRAMHPLPR